MTPAKGYTEMKDSGIEWVGMIPKHWTTIANKYVMHKEKRICEKWDGQDVLSLTMNGVIIRDILNPVGKMPTTFDGYQFSYAGELLMCLFDIDVTPRCVGRVFNDGVTSPAYSCFQLNDNADLGYFYYYYLMVDNTKELLHLAKNLRHSFTEEQLGQLKVPLPPLQEQSAIAAYLDTQCAKIDEIIAQAKASIEDYKQWKASIIYEAVTKGLDPNVEMKDSGIEWIGKMPKHWQDINPKALFSQRKERANPGDRQLTASQQFGVIYQDEYMEMTGTKVVTVEKDFDILKYVSAGDFVISMRSFQGGLEYSTKSGSISSAYVMLVPNLKLVYPRYYRWLLKSNGYIRALQSTSDLVRDGQAMRYSNFAKVRLITLPLGEQEQIANYLDTQCAKIDKLMTEKQSLIDDLESYKKSLIYEVVTGKRRVC